MTNSNGCDVEKRVGELLDALQAAVESNGDVDGANYGEPPEYIDIATPYLPGKFVAPTGRQRYVRVDLVDGDANEPLADGQHRWFMPYYEDVWRVGVVRTVIEDEWECFAFCTAPGEWLCEFEVDKIGPVIRPPEDV